MVDGRPGLVVNVDNKGLKRGSAGYKTHGELRGVGFVAVNPPNIAATATGVVDVTIAGVAVGDIVIMHPPHAFGATGGTAGDDHIVFQGASVQAANTVRIRLGNMYDAGEAQNAPVLDWAYEWYDIN